MNDNNRLQSAVIAAVRAYLAGLDGETQAQNLHPIIMREVERSLIREALRHNRDNQSHAAHWLGISRNTLKKKMIEYGLCLQDNALPLSRARKKTPIPPRK